MLSVRTVMDSTAEVAYLLMVVVSLPLSISLSLSISLPPLLSIPNTLPLSPALYELHGNSNVEKCTKCGREYLRDFRVRTSKRVHSHMTGNHIGVQSCLLI